MTEFHGQGARRWSDPAQEPEREARHALLIDLLGAYVDDELPVETASQLDAHLVGCARCRREVRLQLAVRDRLAAAPLPAVGPPVRDRILAAAFAAQPGERRAPNESPWAAEPRRAQAVPDGSADPSTGLRRRRATHAWLVVVAAIAVAAALVVALRETIVGRPGGAARMPLAELATPAAQVPLLAAAVDDYLRIAGADLPGPARDLDAVRAAVGFPIEPLTGPAVRLLGAWTTTLGGEGAAVLAYRWDDRLVVQYIVPDHLFFRHPALRAPAASHGAVGATVGRVGVVAWPVEAAGALLVGEETPARLAAVRAP